jgi:hypothetical protein
MPDELFLRSYRRQTVVEFRSFRVSRFSATAPRSGERSYIPRFGERSYILCSLVHLQCIAIGRCESRRFCTKELPSIHGPSRMSASQE